MTFGALVLSTDPLYGRGLADVLEGRGLPVRWLRDWPGARTEIETEPAVVIFDAASAVAPAADVLAVTTRYGAPLIVVARDLDAARWIHLFRQGAFDVLRAPLDPAQLRESVWSALTLLRPRENQGWMRKAVHCARSALFPWPRP